MTIALFIIIIALLIYSIVRQGKVAAYDTREIYHAQTAKETLEELRANEILKRDYEFKVPNFGMYRGKRIALSEITRNMKEDPEFLSPQALGKWVRKDEKA